MIDLFVCSHQRACGDQGLPEYKASLSQASPHCTASTSYLQPSEDWDKPTVLQSSRSPARTPWTTLRPAGMACNAWIITPVPSVPLSN
jgi:hypothetical protein